MRNIIHMLVELTRDNTCPVYEEEFERAMTEDRDRASFNVVPKYEYYRVG